MLLDGVTLERAELAGAARRRWNVAFDLTFTAPKGVSVLAAVGDEDVRQAVLDAHAGGVRAGLDYLERGPASCAADATGSGSCRPGLRRAVYLHEMARSGDPHLHAHMVVANRVKGPDGRWSAPDMRPVFAEAKTAGTIAEAVTRDGSPVARARMGSGQRRGRALRGAAAGARALLRAPRRDPRGGGRARLTSPRGIAAIQRETRDRKRVVSRERAADEWRARAAEHGFGEREIAAPSGAAASRVRRTCERLARPG